MKQPPVCFQYLVFPAVAVVHILHQAYPCIAQRSSDQLYDVEAVDDDPGIRKQCLDELDVLSISRPSFVNEQVNWESASLSPHPPAVVSGR